MEQISIKKSAELSELVNLGKLSETELYNFISANLRHFVSDRDNSENNNLTINDKTTIYMGSHCFDYHTINEVIKRLDRINTELIKYHKTENIYEIHFYNQTKRIAVTILKDLNLLNLQDLIKLGLSDLYQESSYIYDDEKQQSRKKKVSKLHFNLDVTKEFGFIIPTN